MTANSLLPLPCIRTSVEGIKERVTDSLRTSYYLGSERVTAPRAVWGVYGECCSSIRDMAQPHNHDTVMWAA